MMGEHMAEKIDMCNKGKKIYYLYFFYYTFNLHGKQEIQYQSIRFCKFILVGQDLSTKKPITSTANPGDNGTTTEPIETDDIRNQTKKPTKSTSNPGDNSTTEKPLEPDDIRNQTKNPMQSTSNPGNGKRCLTTWTNWREASPNVDCVFPFRFKRKTYDECDTDEDGPWCSTQVDKDGNHDGAWGTCGPNCPIAGTQ